jgi:hypothetical protein
MRRLLLITLLAAIPSSVLAQRMSAAPHFSGRPAPFRSPHFNRGAGAYYLPLFDPFYADYLSTPQHPASQPPAIITQPAAAPPAPVSSPPAQPLLIELRGDRYVQISGEADSQSQIIDRTLASSIGPEKDAEAQHSSRPPHYTITVLLFRDGHREEVSNYTIVDGFLYASSSYYTAGAWIRKVELSSLDLPETIASNQSHGVQFRLPSAPNEVIVGP